MNLDTLSERSLVQPLEQLDGTTMAAILLLLGALVLGSIVRLLALRGAEESTANERRASLRTWWLLALGLIAALALAPLGVCVLMGIASWYAFSEYRDMVARNTDRLATRLVFATIPLTYGAILLGHGWPVLAFLPMATLILVAAAQIVHGETKGYVRATGGLVYGAVFLNFGLAHAALLSTLPSTRAETGGGVGWFLYIVVLTESNDIAQALVGRQIGRHKITPQVSPHKTWEGFLGGAFITVVLALVLAPLLTPLGSRLPPQWLDWLPSSFTPWLWPFLSGLVVVFTGFLGDLNMSAVKRDAGVKDSSRRLPGMGGVLDRIDSLSLSAPSFYYLIVASALGAT